MRLLLDAHVSGRAIGQPLREAGHDVLALDADPRFGALGDTDVLALAARGQRVVVTFDVSDFPRIVRTWAHEGREHAGCVIVTGMDHREFGSVLRALKRLFEDRPDQTAWRNAIVFANRATGRP